MFILVGREKDHLQEEKTKKVKKPTKWLGVGYLAHLAGLAKVFLAHLALRYRLKSFFGKLLESFGEFLASFWLRLILDIYKL